MDDKKNDLFYDLEKVIKYFSQNSNYNLFSWNKDFKNLYDHANKIVQYGWKKEALPIINEKKSFIARSF